MPIEYYLYLSIALFCIGIVGVLTRRNAIIIFMCIEGTRGPNSYGEDPKA